MVPADLTEKHTMLLTDLCQQQMGCLHLVLLYIRFLIPSNEMDMRQEEISKC